MPRACGGRAGLLPYPGIGQEYNVRMCVSDSGMDGGLSAHLTDDNGICLIARIRGEGVLDLPAVDAGWG